MGKGGRGGRGEFFAQSYTHIRQSAPVDIAHLAPGFYSTPGLVFDVFHEIIFFRKFSFPCFPLDSARCASWYSVQISFVRCSSIPRLCCCSLIC